MALNLHADCKSRLLTIIERDLPKILVNHGTFLDRASCFFALAEADSALPQHGPSRDKLRQIFDEFPLAQFACDTFADELAELDRCKTGSPPERLTEIDEFRDSAAAASSLVSRFDSLPWKYIFTLQLPSALSGLFERERGGYRLSPHFHVLRPTAEMQKSFSLVPASKEQERRVYGAENLLLGPLIPSWNENSIYAQIIMDGFVGSYGISQTTNDAWRVFKSFFGLGLALRLFEVSRRNVFGRSKSHLIIHKETENRMLVEARYEFSDEQSNAIEGVVLDGLDGRLETENDKILWARGRLHEIAQLLHAVSQEHRILLAAQWLFDSSTGRDELLSFIQATVVLEILLGDKASSEEIGLGELLRNRCAYLIGKSHGQREQILSDFNKIYDVRSRIVHQGKHRLNFQERVLFRQLQWMGKRVIQEEVSLLLADKKAEVVT